MVALCTITDQASARGRESGRLYASAEEAVRATTTRSSRDGATGVAAGR